MCCKKRRDNKYKKLDTSDFETLDELLLEEKPISIDKETENMIQFAYQTADDFAKKSKRVGDKLVMAGKLV